MNKVNTSSLIKTIVKTPGKCLITGGYLILNPNKNGLVVNIDAYFQVTSIIEPISNLVSLSLPQSLPAINLSVKSLYLNEQFSYSISLNQSSIEVTQIDMSNSNKWIENSIKSSFYSFLCLNTDIDPNDLQFQLSNKNIIISIESDYRFYSYDKNSKRKDIKTGLGSSSALIVSLCSNLIALLYKHSSKLSLKINEKSLKELDEHIQSVITYASILSNNISQNKIGSGFDIIACLFGNQIFHQCRLNFPSFDSFNFSNELLKEIVQFLEEYQVKYLNKISLLGNMPSIIKLALISIEHGSDTRIMVKNVLSWAEAHKSNELFDDELFKELDIINTKVIQLIQSNIFCTNDNKTDLLQLLKDKVAILKQLCMEYRNKLKEISKETKVDIEPLVLSSLLDDLIESNQIIYAICPGAGGYDSIFVLGIEENQDDEGFFNKIAFCVNIFNTTHKDDNYKAFVIKSSIVNNGTVFLC